jgi:hypothetical protein
LVPIEPQEPPQSSNLPKPKTGFGIVPENRLPNADHQVAKVANIFNTHCHIDQIFFKLNIVPGSIDFYNPISGPMKKTFSRPSNSKGPMEVLRKYKKQAHGDKFEGCINAICDPKYFEKKHWEWMTIEKDVWFTLGCPVENIGR